MIQILIAMLFVTAAQPALADVTSENHPVLKRTLEQHVESDENSDGILSLAEYRTFVEKQQPKKQPDGRPAGPISTVLANGDMVISDFEENNLGRMREWGWTIDGEAFNRDLNTGTQIMKRRAGSYQGKYLLSSLILSDDDVGAILSPSFDVELNFIELSMSGGDYPQRVCVNLMVDDQVVRTASGLNDDLLEPVAFNVSAFKGHAARMQIVDADRRVWGHINVDRIYQTDHPRAERVIDEVPKDYGKTTARLQTLDGTSRRGPLSIGTGRLTIGNDVVELDSLLLAVCDNVSDQTVATSSLRLTSGEVWNARILGLAKDQVSIESPLFGPRQVSMSQIASLDFIPGPTAAGEPGTLYRAAGEPIPGKLIWIREKDIAIDCPLGVVPIPRQSVTRFVIGPVDPSAGGADDEIALTDGSLFRGQLGLENDQLLLTHPTLGSLSFALDAVRYVKRTPEGVLWFDQLEASDLERVGPVLPPPPPLVAGADEKGYLRSVRMLPRTVARFSLPPDAQFFRAELAPVGGARADVKVKILAGERSVWEQNVSATSNSISIAADLSGATELTIEVDFDERLAFPCGVNWLDAYVLAKK